MLESLENRILFKSQLKLEVFAFDYEKVMNHLRSPAETKAGTSVKILANAFQSTTRAIYFNKQMNWIQQTSLAVLCSF